MSSARLTDLVEAFTELGPAWGRWVHACLPDDAVSFPRLRVLTALASVSVGHTMKELAGELEVTPRRVTVLVDALEADGLVSRRAHPTDGRSTVVTITEAGLAHQRLGWRSHQDRVAAVFGELSEDDQDRLLAISRELIDGLKALWAASR